MVYYLLNHCYLLYTNLNVKLNYQIYVEIKTIQDKSER